MERPSFELDIKTVTSSRGNKSLIVNAYKFVKQAELKSGYVKWFCEKRRRIKCQAKCITHGDSLELVGFDLQHTHDPDVKKYIRQEISNLCKRKALEDIDTPARTLVLEEIASKIDDEAISELDDKDIQYIRKNVRAARVALPTVPTENDLKKPRNT